VDASDRSSRLSSGRCPGVRLFGMDFRVLGPLEVCDGERSLPLGGFRQRLVLGVLLLHPDRVLTTDWLVDAIWGEDPPRTARKTL
jgi:DNA-binding SARP family transcriptional activator